MSSEVLGIVVVGASNALIAGRDFGFESAAGAMSAVVDVRRLRGEIKFSKGRRFGAKHLG